MKRKVSKVLAFALIFAVLIGFVPLLQGDAYAQTNGDKVKVIVTPKEYDIVNRSMKVDISVSEEGYHLAYLSDSMLSEGLYFQSLSYEECFGYAEKVQDVLQDVIIGSGDYLNVWIIDEDGNPLNEKFRPNYFFSPQYYGPTKPTWDDMFIEDRDNSIKMVNGYAYEDFDLGLHMEQGKLFFNQPDKGPATAFQFCVLLETEYGYSMESSWSDNGEYGFVQFADKSYDGLIPSFDESGTYEIVAIIETEGENATHSRAYRTTYTYNCPEEKIDTVENLQWYDEANRIVSFTAVEGAYGYTAEITNTEGNYGYTYTSDEADSHFTEKDGLILLDVSSVYDEELNRIGIKTYSNDIENKAHSDYVWMGEKEADTEPDTQPTESEVQPTEPEVQPTETETETVATSGNAETPDVDGDEEDDDSVVAEITTAALDKNITVQGGFTNQITADTDTKFVNAGGAAVDTRDVLVNVTDIGGAASEEIATAVEEHSKKGVVINVYYFDMTAYAQKISEETRVTLQDGTVRIHMTYPQGTSGDNEIIVLHGTEEVSVEKDADGFWICADGFSPYALIIKDAPSTQEGTTPVAVEKPAEAAETGDGTNMYLYVLLGALSVSCFVGMSARKSKLN